jgi:hypothetical protein
MEINLQDEAVCLANNYLMVMILFMLAIPCINISLKMKD